MKHKVSMQFLCESKIKLQVSTFTYYISGAEHEKAKFVLVITSVAHEYC